MRKLLAFVLSLTLVLASSAAFAPVAGAASKFGIAEDAVIAERIQAFADIKAMFAGKSPIADIRSFYINKFQAETRRIDATIKPDDPKIDENVSLVLDAAVAGEINYAQAQQAVDKGLQWYFFFALRDIINNQVKPVITSGDTAAATKAFDKVVQIYEGVLQATVDKRDKSYNLHMVDSLQGALEQIRADVAAGNVEDYNAHRQILDKTLIKTYTLATLTYANSIPTKPAADQAAAITEGFFLYMPVFTYLRGGSVTDATYVLDAFASGDPERIDSKAIAQALRNTLIGKVNEYVGGATTKLEAGDRAGARGTGTEGIMFAAAQDVFLGEDYAELADYSQKFINAIENSDLTAAKSNGFQMVKIVNEGQGIHLKLNDIHYTVNGEANTAENAPFLNEDTGRTLVPVRLIAQSLNAVVDYVDETRTVRIVKDGQTTELVVGSADIVQNGKVNDKAKLDQPVLIRNDSSFIPLRAVAELFGKRVFYEQGEILVVR